MILAVSQEGKGALGKVPGVAQSTWRLSGRICSARLMGLSSAPSDAAAAAGPPTTHGEQGFNAGVGKTFAVESERKYF